ncbi:MAG: peptide ABC transporter substrate-binding protein [Candidatus Gracilibacteria bacterium]|nr:peptide ABC transporter substrate-binding protein [Candidatus Gracilibacteria bacterium]
MLKIFKALKEQERYLVTILLVVFLFGLAGISKQFYYFATSSTPDEGGTFREAMLGRVSSLNPLFAQGNSVDQDLTSLIFSGLTKYDPETKEVAGDLAYKWDISNDGLSYTFYLRDELYWHDGEILDADDIIFTYTTIQNPLFEGRIKTLFSDITLEKLDQKSIKFTLKKENAFFPGLLSLGLLPEHLLKNTAPESLRTAGFKSHPIGCGPFIFVSMSSNSAFDRVELDAFSKYHGQQSFLKKVVIFAYEEYAQLLGDADSFDGVRDLKEEDLSKMGDDYNIRALKLPRYEAAIFNLDNKILSQQKVREALSISLDQEAVLKQIGNGELVNAPLTILEGYENVYDLSKAATLLDEAGYKLGEGQSFRQDADGNKLELNLVTLASEGKSGLAESLQSEWNKLGVVINIVALDAGTLNLDYIANRNYDILLIGQNLGSDIDLYSFWHSSQAKNGQNLAQLKSIDVDLLIEKIRKTHNFATQLELTRKLADAILADYPAVFLYTPYYNYAISKNIKSPLIPENISVPSDRYALISDWYVKEKRVWK